MEQYMDFEKKVQQVHKPNRVNPEALKTLTGTQITEEWKIICKKDAGIVISTVVLDLQDYFKVSMNLSLAVETGEGPVAKTIFVSVDDTLEERSFRTQVTDGIVITGTDPRHAAQGCYALEDTLNLNEAPIIEPGDIIRKMRFFYAGYQHRYGYGMLPRRPSERHRSRRLYCCGPGYAQGSGKSRGCQAGQ